MGRSLHVRLDDASAAALDIVRADGLNESEAVRTALREAAERRRRRSALREEARLASEDPDDLAEARRVREDMDMLAAPWPEP
jgi:hypothetical protein